MNQVSNQSIKKSNILSSSFMETSLPEKIVECWLRQNDTEYQQLLIEQKQLELMLLEQEAKSKIMMKNFSKRKKSVDDLQQEFDNMNKQLGQKKLYLSNYYQHLNNRLRADATSISLISKIQNLSTQLNTKIENEKVYLDSLLHSFREQIVKLEEEKVFLENKKENLKSNLFNLKQAKQTFKSQQEKKRQIEKKRRIELKQQYEQLQTEFKAQMEEKKHLENNQNILKKLLNIEEVHKKYWLLLQKAIKNEFANKVIERVKKQAVNLEYKEKIQEKKQQITKKKTQLESLTSQMDGVVRKKNSMKNILAQTTHRYNQLQRQLLAANQPK